MKHGNLKILHIFADNGVETEPLSAYGKVTRVGINPQNTEYTHKLIQADLKEWRPKKQYDLMLAHPPCQFASNLTHAQGNADDHENLIPLARRIGKEHADEYILENVPQAVKKDEGLKKEQSVVLNGTNFNLPTPFKRAFETSFDVSSPSQKRLDYDNKGFEKHNATGGWQGGKQLWKTVKQVSGDYKTKELVRNGIPAPYIHHLMRYYLLSKDGG